MSISALSASLNQVCNHSTKFPFWDFEKPFIFVTFVAKSDLICNKLSFQR